MSTIFASKSLVSLCLLSIAAWLRLGLESEDEEVGSVDGFNLASIALAIADLSGGASLMMRRERESNSTDSEVDSGKGRKLETTLQLVHPANPSLKVNRF